MSKIHKREEIVRKAQAELTEWKMKHDLTPGEMIRVWSDELSSLAKWMIRGERHPDDPETPGGIE